MSLIPETLKYTKDHEWILLEKNQGTIGITDFAQKALGDIVYIELPEVGQKIEMGKSFGVVESIKSVSDLFAPLSGEVLQVNEDLPNSPENCNSDPYGAWMVKIKITNEKGLSELLNNLQYQDHCNKTT